MKTWRFVLLGLLVSTSIGCSPSLIDLVLKQDSPGVKAALSAGANPNQVDREGNSVLELAVKGGNQNIFKSLLDAGAEPNSAVYECCHLHNGDFLRELLRRGADPELPNPWPRTKDDSPTPLFVASSAHWPGTDGSDAVQALVDFGANVNRQSVTGFTPLSNAIFSGSQFGSALVLLRAGADPRLGPTNILNHTAHSWSLAKDVAGRRRIMDRAVNGPDRKAAETWLKMRLLLIEKGFLNEDPDKVIPDADPRAEKRPADE